MRKHVLIIWAFTVIFQTAAYSAERVVQFAGVVSSITERRETTEFLDKVLCNLVIVNTSQTVSNQIIVDVNFYNYGYSGGSITSTRISALNPPPADAVRYNQIFIDSPSGPTCIGQTLHPLGTCVMQFITNTIPAGSSTVGVCAGNVRVKDELPSAPGFVVASGSASLIQEVKILGGVLSGAYFMSGPSSTQTGTTGGLIAPGATTTADGPKAAGITAGNEFTLPSNMNIECKTQCNATALQNGPAKYGIIQTLSRAQNPGTDGNVTHGVGSVFDTVRAFCRSSTPPLTTYYSGKLMYDALWASGTAGGVSPSGNATGLTTSTFGSKTAFSGGTGDCNTFATTNYAKSLRECHWRYFEDHCVAIANELERQFYQGGLGYTEQDIVSAFQWEFNNLNNQMMTDQVFRNKCFLPMALLNQQNAATNADANTTQGSAATSAVAPNKFAAYPGTTADLPSANCINNVLNTDKADQTIGYIGSTIVNTVVTDALNFSSNSTPFRYTNLSDGATPSRVCDAVCGGASVSVGASVIHEPNQGMEAGVIDNSATRGTEIGTKLTFGSLAQKIAPPEFGGGIVKEMLIGGFGTICSANDTFTTYNNIKDPTAFASQSINNHYRYCENRPQGGSDDLLFGVQGLIGFPVNGGSPF